MLRDPIFFFQKKVKAFHTYAYFIAGNPPVVLDSIDAFIHGYGREKLNRWLASCFSYNLSYVYLSLAPILLHCTVHKLFSAETVNDECVEELSALSGCGIAVGFNATICFKAL